jgi:tripartite ATP-independent transporter DctM subunit
MALVLLLGLVVSLAAGIEIFVAMGFMASIGLWFFVGDTFQQFASSGWALVNSFTMTCVPFFIFMGSIFSQTGVVKGLFLAADKWIGRVPGGLACSVLGANSVFGAMSGSSVAATATFGKIAYPQMEKMGYDARLGLGSIAIGGSLSVLIPPSIILVVYGGWQELSVARLFAGGMIPGFLLATLLMLTIIVRVKLNPNLAPKTKKVTWREKLFAAGQILPFIVIIIIVLGSIFTGIMTPTESAAMGAFLSILLTLAYRRLNFKAFKESMLEAVKITTMICFVMFTARVLGQIFQYIGLTEAFSTFIHQLPLGRYGILTCICIMYLILGMFFDSFSMMLLTLPFVSPLLSDLGFDLIWFGVLFTILAEIGLVTPPFGLNLFVLQGVVPKHDLMAVARSTLPFVLPALAMVVILTVFPELVLWLPSILY